MCVRGRNPFPAQTLSRYPPDFPAEKQHSLCNLWLFFKKAHVGRGKDQSRRQQHLVSLSDAEKVLELGAEPPHQGLQPDDQLSKKQEGWAGVQVMCQYLYSPESELFGKRKRRNRYMDCTEKMAA